MTACQDTLAQTESARASVKSDRHSLSVRKLTVICHVAVAMKTRDNVRGGSI